MQGHGNGDLPPFDGRFELVRPVDFDAFVADERRAFEDRFGLNGLTKLWEEIIRWVRSPKLFFRNYSVDYFEHLFS